MKLNPNNLRAALTIAVASERKSRFDAGLVGDSALLAGWIDTIDALDRGESVYTEPSLPSVGPSAGITAEELRRQILLLRNTNPAAAVRFYREKTGASLRVAYQYVTELK